MSLLDRLLGRTKRASPEEIYHGLRAQILSTSPDALGIDPADVVDGVWAALMDWNLDGNIVTVVAVADGAVSLYYSSGGGIIGAGAHDAPRQAAGTFLRVAAEQRASLQAATGAALPLGGMTRFLVRTTTGDLAGEAMTDDLGEGRHPLAPLFYAAQNVITAVRTLPPVASEG